MTEDKVSHGIVRVVRISKSQLVFIRVCDSFHDPPPGPWTVEHTPPVRQRPVEIPLYLDHKLVLQTNYETIPFQEQNCADHNSIHYQHNSSSR